MHFKLFFDCGRDKVGYAKAILSHTHSACRGAAICKDYVSARQKTFKRQPRVNHERIIAFHIDSLRKFIITDQRLPLFVMYLRLLKVMYKLIGALLLFSSDLST